MSDVMTAEAPASSPNATPLITDMIVCEIDGGKCHSIALYLRDNHPDWTVERYEAEYPNKPVLSAYAKMVIETKAREKAEERAKAAAPAAAAQQIKANLQMDQLTVPTLSVRPTPLHELFGLGAAQAARNGRGDPIAVSVLEGHSDAGLLHIPEIDPDYVYDIDLLKKVIMGFQLRMNVYLWGYHGTGKTTILEQAAARTQRPFIRVQHTVNMQESDVLGQWTVRDGSTHFQLGDLPLAMLNGWVYCADEYDVAMPSVVALYQAVLEHKALVIKDAPPHFRKIVPHEQFRFVATGNTNGTGDETGLYQGTLVQNAANYSRFEITEEVKYMEPRIEASVIMSKTRLDRASAEKIVSFGNKVREAFINGKISMTISPRELINASLIGLAYGANWKMGLELAYANRLSRIDKKVVSEFAQRLFA